jgi:Spy/CpxP family protein refolding chaperone
MRPASRALALLALLGMPALAFAQHQPYTGQQSREVKSLSPQEVDDLLAGRGMGTAKPAELNRYPGPAHVLELKERLELTPEQEKRTRAIHAAMQSEASAAGRRVVDAERTLDEAFAKGVIDQAALAGQVRELGRLHGEFRLAHLKAHIETKALLTPGQISRYDHLRGYAGDKAHGGHKH